MKKNPVSSWARIAAMVALAIAGCIGAVSAEAPKCEAKTGTGLPCKNQITVGKFCREHQPPKPPAMSLAKCAGKIRDGKPCPNPVKFGSSYCNGPHVSPGEIRREPAK
jgi:hypothetical protein